MINIKQRKTKIDPRIKLKINIKLSTESKHDNHSLRLCSYTLEFYLLTQNMMIMV